MKTSYQKLLLFLSEWSKDDINSITDAFKLSMTKDLVSILYNRNSLKNEKLKPNFIRRNNFNVLLGFNKKLWFLLWAIKWIIFFRWTKEKRLIILAIGSNEKNINAYISQFAFLASKNNLIVILLNIINPQKYFFNNTIFYFPRILFRPEKEINPKEQSIIFNEILSSFSSLTNVMDLSKNELLKLKKVYKKMIFDFNSFNSFINKVKKNNIISLFQDYDYTYNKVLYYFLANKHKVRTLTLDTSLNIYREFYQKYLSEYHCVYGDYKKDFILKHNNIFVDNIVVIGKPQTEYKIANETQTENNIWIYLAQSYSNPSMFSEGRSYEFFKNNIQRLKNISKKHFPDIEFKLKIHPADRITDFNLGVEIIKDKCFDSVLNKTRIIFCEDSTLTLELVFSGYPVIYLLDSLNRDNIGLANQDIYLSINLSTITETELQTILSNQIKIDKERIKDLKSYYLGNYDPERFNNILLKLLK